MGKRILITGVAGFLGSHLADKLISQNHEVVGVDSLLGGYFDNVPEGVEFHVLDCNDRAVIDVAKDIDIIFHRAATAYEGLSVFSPHMINHNNFQSTAQLLNATVTHNVDRFVYTSSMARYGTNEARLKKL